MNAIVVSISITYSQLNADGAERGSGALYNVTTCWWPIDVALAQNARYLFGAYRGAIVSAYEIVAPVAQWPVMPSKPDNLAGRRAVPATEVSEPEWKRASRWRVGDGDMVRYAEVLLRDGKIYELRL